MGSVLLLQFEDGTSGGVTYDLPTVNRSGVIPIVRMAPDRVAACQADSTPSH